MFRDIPTNCIRSFPLSNNTLNAILKQASEQKATRINLSTLYIRDEQAEIIADFLKKNHHLLRLNLSKNIIGAKGLAKIAEALEWNHTLTHLDLADNKIHTKDIKKLIPVLNVNKKLLYINLAFNYIGDKGARLIADALVENKTIKLIDLTANKITYISRKPQEIFIYDFLFAKKERPLYVPWAEKKHETKIIKNAFLFFEEPKTYETEHDLYTEKKATEPRPSGRVAGLAKGL